MLPVDSFIYWEVSGKLFVSLTPTSKGSG